MPNIFIQLSFGLDPPLKYTQKASAQNFFDKLIEDCKPYYHSESKEYGVKFPDQLNQTFINSYGKKITGYEFLTYFKLWDLFYTHSSGDPIDGVISSWSQLALPLEY